VPTIKQPDAAGDAAFPAMSNATLSKRAFLGWIGASAGAAVLETTDLGNPSWTNVGTPVAATAIQTSAGDLQGAGLIFYRLRVVP
jgi:hypothetical protein